MALLLQEAQKVGLQLLLEPQASAIVFRAACTTVGTVYPVYATFKAIESQPEAKKEQHSQWLTYWAIYGSMSIAESLTDNLLCRFPYYFHAKLALLIWLQLPQTQGAKVLYSKYMRPALVKYQEKIDVVLDFWRRFLGGLYSANKGTIDALGGVAVLGYSQCKEFMKWFLEDNKPKSALP